MIFDREKGELDFEAEEVEKPARSYMAVQKEVEKVDQRISEIEAAFDEYAEKHTGHLENSLLRLEEEADFSITMALSDQTKSPLAGIEDVL